MDIVHCTQGHTARWDDYAIQNEAATFYHRFAWKDINEKSFGHRTFYLAAVDGNEFRGIFPIVFLRSRIFGRMLCSMPFVNLGGPCASDATTMDGLVEEAGKILVATQADYLEMRSRTRLDTQGPTSEHKVSMTIELSHDPEDVWKAFTSKHRNTIRSAQRKGFTTSVGGAEQLDQFYDVLSESWRSLGTPLYAKSYFREIAERLAGSISIFLVLHEGKPVGAAFNGLHRQTVEGMWAGTTAAYRRSDANYVLYWDMIKHYCANGFTRFHLGRSTVDSGAEAFKKKWLAHGSQLYWQYVLGRARSVPQLNVSNPKYQLAIRTWRHLPLVVTRRLGPMIAKSIP